MNIPRIQSSPEAPIVSAIEDHAPPLVGGRTWDEQANSALDVAAIPMQQDVSPTAVSPHYTIDETEEDGKGCEHNDHDDRDGSAHINDDHDDDCRSSEHHKTTEVQKNDDEKRMLVVSSTKPNPLIVRDSVVSSLATLTSVISPKFDFLIAESIDQLKLEEDSAKRRHEFHTRFYQMDCRLAGLLARCVVEGAERHAGLKVIFPDVCRQLEHLSDRYFGNKLQFDGERTRLLAIQRRVQSIHSKMVKHHQETLHDLKDEVFETLHLEMLQNVQPSLQMEVQKADKRESTRFRKFESLAGTVARRFYEETATRKAAEVSLGEQIDLLSQPESKVNFLEQLRTIRAELQQERETRRARDAQVLSDVHSTCDALKRAVLEAVGTAIG